MSRNFEPGIPAKYKYQSVRYFPFNTNPGVSYVLTSDPWSYLKAWLDQKSLNSRGDNKNRLTKAKYFLEQAESFQLAADQTRLPTKATLTYYSLLNLTKAFLSVRGLDLEHKEEVHGISLTNKKGELNIQGPMRRQCTNIFYEFCDQLGRPYDGKHKINIDEVYSDIPEIHEIAFTLGKVDTRKFLPVEIDFLTNEDKSKLFTEVSFKKENESRLPIQKFYKNSRKKYFKLLDELREGKVIYRSSKRKSLNNENFPTIYKNVCKEYSKLDVDLILTRDGYKYYVNLNPNSYHQLANVMLMNFYMGTAARYRPTTTQEIMSGELYPIIAEIIETSPRQFLYQITSLMTESICAVPKALI